MKRYVYCITLLITLSFLNMASSGCQNKTVAPTVTVTAPISIVTQMITETNPVTITATSSPVTLTVTSIKEVVTTLSPPTPSNVPGMPQLTSPTDKSIFTQYPRKTTLKWSTGSGEKPITYLLEMQYSWSGDYTAFGSWQEGDYQGIVIPVNTTIYSFDFVGAQPGRWRVKAINQYGVSEWSEWWYFRYTS